MESSGPRDSEPRHTVLRGGLSDLSAQDPVRNCVTDARNATGSSYVGVSDRRAQYEPAIWCPTLRRSNATTKTEKGREQIRTGVHFCCVWQNRDLAIQLQQC